MTHAVHAVPLHLLTAMASEAATLPDLGSWEKNEEGFWESTTHARNIHVSRAGVGQTRSYQCARSLFARGVPSLLIFGIAGGLYPDLVSGDIVISTTIISEQHHKRYQANPELLENAIAKAQHLNSHRVVYAPIFSQETALETPAEKQSAYTRTHAFVVDMESAGVAQAAQEANRPFVSIRVVCDPAIRTVPSAFSSCLTEEGTVDTWGLMRTLMRNPRLIGSIPAMQRDYARALKSLKHVWETIFNL